MTEKSKLRKNKTIKNSLEGRISAYEKKIEGRISKYCLHEEKNNDNVFKFHFLLIGMMDQ